MGSLEKENSLKSTVMEELIKGQEKVNKLESFLVDDEKAKELLRELRNSILKAITVIDSGEVSEVCQDSDRKSESSSRKRKAVVTVKEGKVGGRRRRMSSYPSRKVTANTAEDGFSWRKYGQKEIFGSTTPRSYFRCTHKHDRNCQAIRQVQKSEEDPTLYVITYMGEHTCKDPINTSQLLATPHDHASSRLISFGSNNNDENIGLPFASFSSLKQELDEEVLSNMTSGSSPPEFTALERMLPEMMTPDETSGFGCSSDSLDMGIMQGFFDIDGLLNQEVLFQD